MIGVRQGDRVVVRDVLKSRELSARVMDSFFIEAVLW
jgi:hypothetical protein